MNPQIGLHLHFVMAWLRGLQSDLWPIAPRPWQGEFDLLNTLAYLDRRQLGEGSVHCRWALAAANGLRVCRAVCRWPWAALTLGGFFSLCLLP